MSNLRVQIIAAVVMLLCFVVSGVSSSAIAASAGRHRLVYTDTAAEGDPPQVAVGIAMGAFRGMFVNWLWIRANEEKMAGRYHEAIELADAITTLQPRFPRVWAFHAWNMAYNISVKTRTPEERWQWVMAGVRLLQKEGIKHNPNDLLLHKELAWIYLHKIQGVTDDANQFYKVRLATEWTTILGPPPAPSPEMRSREQSMERYVEWLTPIAEAPPTLSGAIEADPLVEVVRAKVRRMLGREDPEEILELYTIHTEMHRLGLDDHTELDSMGQMNRAFAMLTHEEGLEDAWEGYINHLRRRVVEDEFGMDLSRMIRYTEMYGPLDWRHPAAHALYWSRTGVERAFGRETEANEKDYDFLNTDRITVQSMQELFRSGEIYFDFFEAAKGEFAYYFAIPSTNFIDAYYELMEESRERAGVYGDRNKIFTMFSAGFQNFIEDAIMMFYRRGQIKQAELYQKRLREYPGRNRNDWRLEEKYSAPIDEFVQMEMVDRYTSPTTYRTQVFAALQGAFINGLLVGDIEMFERQYSFARDFHKYFISQQLRDVQASGGAARMEVFDRDFRVTAGFVFAQVLGMVNVEQASGMYLLAPNDLRQFAFMAFEQQIPSGMTQEQFLELFPMPEGFAQFKARYEAQRADRRIDTDVQSK